MPSRSSISAGAIPPPSRKMSQNGRKIPFLIGVAGGTASGKSTVCAKLMETLGQNQMKCVEKEVVSLSQDSFYRELTPQEIAKAEKGMFNFDHPDAFDHHLMETVIQVACYVRVRERHLIST